MTTIAQTIKHDIETKCPGCFSLYAGYGMNGGQCVRWPTGAQLKERRNDSGRCTFAEYAYADGSRLAYRYHTGRQTYTLTAH